MEQVESVPEVWDDQRDSAFFRITARLFPCEWLEGATALLVTYDPDEQTASETPCTSPSVPSRVPSTPAPVHVRPSA